MNLLRAGLFLSVISCAAAAQHWDPVSPADLASTQPTVDPEAPAEALFRRIDVDDRNFPGGRTITAYNRYRIFKPDQATELTRIAALSFSVNGEAMNGETSIRARLILPDGTTKEFGDEAIRQRSLVRAAGESSWLQQLFGSSGVQGSEKFLAVPGIVPGSILETQVVQRQQSNLTGGMSFTTTLQQLRIPARLLTFTYRASDDPNWSTHPFTLNASPNHATVEADPKHHVLRLVAHDLPALYREPFSVPLPDYALTFIAAYKPIHVVLRSHHIGMGQSYRIDPKTDPWGAYATDVYLVEDDRTQETGRFRSIARTITAAAPSDLAKAQAIHDYVQALHHRYVASPHPNIRSNDIESEVQLLEFERNPELGFGTDDFAFLEFALDRGAGLTAQTVMLPSLLFARFDRRLVADPLLPIFAVRVKVGDQWHLSLPTVDARLTLDELPWPYEGQEGLVARPEKQEFFPVPAATAAQSHIETTGTFELSAEGTLTGNVVRTFTGHHAELRRTAIQRANPAQIKRYFFTGLSRELKGATIRITEVKAAHDPTLPLEVDFTVTWPEFAVATKNRLIFHPSLFHFGQVSPFTAEHRRYDFQFPFRWSDAEHSTIAMPAGFELESKQAPNGMDGGSISYQSTISLKPVSKMILYSRAVTANLESAQANQNAIIRALYQGMAERDAYELVLRRIAPEATEAQTEAP